MFFLYPRFKSNKELLESNFHVVGKYCSMVIPRTYCRIFVILIVLEYNILKGFTYVKGDDGATEDPQQGILVKESESLYTLWCSGRAGCNGLLVELKVIFFCNNYHKHFP